MPTLTTSLDPGARNLSAQNDLTVGHSDSVGEAGKTSGDAALRSGARRSNHRKLRLRATPGRSYGNTSLAGRPREAQDLRQAAPEASRTAGFAGRRTGKAQRVPEPVRKQAAGPPGIAPAGAVAAARRALSRRA
jgi:hypothetical protein